MFRRHVQAAAIAIAGMLASHAAFADTMVTGTINFQDLTNSANLTLTAIQGNAVTGDSGTFSVNIPTADYGQAVEINDFLTLCTTIDLYNWDNLYNQNNNSKDNIAVGFNVTQPGTGNGTIKGTESGQVDWGSGSVSWPSSIVTGHGQNKTTTPNDPLTLTLAGTDGATLTIELGSAELGLVNGNNDNDCRRSRSYTYCADIPAWITYTPGTNGGAGNVPPTVPEPASLALLAPALLGLGFISLAKKRA